MMMMEILLRPMLQQILLQVFKIIFILKLICFPRNITEVLMDLLMVMIDLMMRMVLVGVQNHNCLRLHLIGLRLQQHLNKLTPRILMNRILSIIQMMMVHQTLANPQMMYLVFLTLLPMLMIRRN